MESLAHQLLPVLEPLQTQIKDWQCRVVPSAFNSKDDTLRALPLEAQWRLPSIEEHLVAFKPQTLILQLPSFWQVEPFIHYAARKAEAPICIIEPQNFPLDKAAIRLASADTILAEATEAAAIAEYLTAGNIQLPPYWILVHAADASQWSMPTLLTNKQLTVASEVQLAPGVPLLVQWAAVVTERSGLYHQSDIFTWSVDLSAPAITTKEPMLFTLTDFALPFTLKNAGHCACGKMLFAREA